MRGVLRRTPWRACVSQDNLTSLTNQLNRNERLAKYGSSGHPAGVPRLSRLSVRPIRTLHETPHLVVAGRSRCNGFDSNAYALINKQTQRAVLVDACDDWPDDWVAYLAASRVRPTHVFLTHCHVDNLVNLNALLAIVAQHMRVRMGVMWCVADRPWLDAFPRVCARYGRRVEAAQVLPMLRVCNPFATLQQQQRHHGYSRDVAATTMADEPVAPQPQLMTVTQQCRVERVVNGGAGGGEEEVTVYDDVWLSCATNRSTSFFELGPHSVLFYVHTPGHSPGHVMLSLPRERLLFSGDVLFYNGVGRVDLPYANGEQLAESLLTLEDFADGTVVLPGHGRPTTLGRERRHNLALRALYERRAIGMQSVHIGNNSGYL